MPANVAAVVDTPLEIFGGLVSDVAPTDLPQGASPDNQDVKFQTGLVGTRPGLQNVFAAIAGNPTFNYLKTYITQQQALRMLALDSLGNVYKENPQGTLNVIGGVTASEYAKSASQFTREYIAFGDGKFGVDIPRQYDDTNFDRVSQCGPGAPPVAGDESGSLTIDSNASAVIQPASQAIASISFSNGIVTVATASSWGLGVVGESVVISGVTPTTYNGTFVTLTASPLQFTYALIGVSSLAAGAGGTVASQGAAFEVDVVATAGASAFRYLYPNGLSVTAAGVSTAAYNSTWKIIGLSVWNNGGTNNLLIYVNTNLTGTAPGHGGSLTVNGNIVAGVHGLSVCFKTRQGYITAPAPPTSWTSAGSKRAIVQIPTGPPNVIARIIIVTLAGGASYYYLTGVTQIASSNFVINDNVTTTVAIDFTDAILAAGTSADYLFRLVELGECQGTIDYASREFWWGERAKVQNILNFTFDGGFGTDSVGRLYPLGWVEDPTFYPGGADVLTTYPALPVVWGNAYSITGNGVAATRGLMTQSVYQDINGVNIIQPNVAYSVRVRIARNSTLVQGAAHVHLFSASTGIDAGLNVTAAQAGLAYAEFTAVLTNGIASPPTDLAIRVYADGTPTNNGVFLVENIEMYPTLQPFNTSLVRGSRVEDPESMDGVNGIMQYGENDGTRVTTAFKIRNNLYFVKERSLWQTADDGINEPAKWSISQISTLVGSPSVNGVGVGSDWVVLAGRLGLYYYAGGEPEKISQEIQKSVVTATGTRLAGWDDINWQFGHTIWCQVDERQRRILVGAPVFGATSPNIIFVLDYRGLDTGTDITQHKSIHISAYTGKIYDIADSRKWTRWNITANSGAQIERLDGTAHVFIGNGAGTGKIYDLLDVENFTNPAQFGDDGVAINSYYDTYYFLRPAEEEQYQLGSHRKLYRYLTFYMEGQGTPSVTAFPPGDASGTAIPQSGIPMPVLSSPLFPVNITSISLTNNRVTVITAANHNVTTACVINGTGSAVFDGTTFGNITVLSPTSFSFPLQGPNIAAINAGTANSLIRDIEVPLNFLTERSKFRIGTNAVGSWFQLRTLTPSIMGDPWSPVRGIN